MVVSSAFLFTSFSSKAQTLVPGQEYMTGNVVIPTNQGGPSSWTGSVYQDSLSCWTWGNPGYCGPNAIVRPGNNINFSFGSSYIYQQQNVSSLLPSSTPGLQVSGYEFQFTAKNGNGWDDGRTDQLTALVRFWDTTGGRGTANLLYGQSYNLNYKFNWTNFNFKETFSSPLDSSTIGQVQYGFLGRDNNGWAGPYGPEVNNVSFSLKYKVDTCTLDPLSSSTCPGYTTALLNSLPKTTVQEVVSPVAAITPTVTVLTPTTTTPPAQTVVETVSAPAQSTSTTATPVASTQTTSASSSTPTATNPQPKVGEVTVSGSAAKTTMSTSQVLAIVRSEQTRIGNLENSTSQQAVEQAQAAGDKAQQESVSVSAAMVSQSQASAQSATDRLQQDRQTNSSPVSLQNQSSTQPGVSSVSNGSFAINNQMQLQNQATSSASTTQTVNSRQQNIYSLFNQVQVQQTETLSSAPAQSPYSFQRNEIFKVQEEPIKVEGMRFNATNPIFNIINAPLATQTETQESQNTLAVNSKVQNNEIAGNVSLESMATQPRGFDSYLGVLSDVAFYAPKEIYRNQRTVDNARALRQLSTDRLHQEMVNQQYRN